jgi:hypothetical protein
MAGVGKTANRAGWNYLILQSNGAGDAVGDSAWTTLGLNAATTRPQALSCSTSATRAFIVGSDRRGG